MPRRIHMEDGKLISDEQLELQSQAQDDEDNED
jgi:hypothetical protein